MLKNVIVPKKNWDPELYEILRHLQLQAQQAAGGLAAVGRGEQPDGSGNPLVDTGIFFLLAGRPGNQRGYGGTNAVGTLTFSSTNNASKGFIYFGSPTIFVSMDETQKFVGVNVSVPTATLHLQSVTATTVTLTPSSDIDTKWDGPRDAAQALAGGSLASAANSRAPSDAALWAGYSTAPLGQTPQQFGMNGTITPGRLWRVNMYCSILSGTAVAGDVGFSIRDANGDEYTYTETGTALAGVSTFPTFSLVTFIVDGTGAKTATGQTPNSIKVGVVFSNPAGGYCAVTYIEIINGGDSDIAKWNNSSGTLLGKIDATGQVGIGTGSATLSAMATIIPSSSSTFGLRIKGASSQSARLLQLQNSSGTELGGFSSAGAMFFISGAASGKVWTSDSGGVGSWGDIDQARTWATLQTFKDTTFKVVDDADASKTLVFSLGGASANADLTLAWNGTADRTVTLPNYTGLIPIVGDDPPAVAAGALGKVDLTGQVADIATTNLTNGALTGQYQVFAVVECTTSDGAAGSITLTISWTDDAGATTSTVVRSLSLGTARSTLSVPLYVASGEISYAITHTGTYGTAVYALRIRVIALG